MIGLVFVIKLRKNGVKMRLSIRNQKARGKFCQYMNRIFGCRDVYMCNVACPFYLWGEVIDLMDLKNLPLGEAIRLCVRASIDREDGKKIIKEAIEGKAKVYPPKDWEKKA